MKRRNIKTILFAGCFLWLGLADAALAAAPTKGPPKVIELETMVIEGKIAKPQVFYVLGRSRIEYRGIKLKRSFVSRILDSAKRNPF